MDSKEYLANVTRDAILIDSLHRALYAMNLTNGATVIVGGVRSTLHFDHEMEKLRRSLYLLGIDTREALAVPSGGRDKRQAG